MDGMFQDCTNLTVLDLSDWNTANCTNMNNMFKGCTSLTDIGDVYNNWTVTQVTTHTGFSTGSQLIDLSIPNWYSPPARVPCFKEGTKILSYIFGTERYVPIEQLRSGDLVKTLRHGYVPISMIGYSKLYNSGNNERIKHRLYKLSQDQYPSLKEDLYITGCHSLLVGDITPKQREQTIDVLGKIYVTDRKYRLPACVDEKAKPYKEEGTFTIWHLALDNNDYYMNYGIYANGLLVESCSKRYLKEESKMTIV